MKTLKDFEKEYSKKEAKILYSNKIKERALACGLNINATESEVVEQENIIKSRALACGLDENSHPNDIDVKESELRRSEIIKRVKKRKNA